MGGQMEWSLMVSLRYALDKRTLSHNWECSFGMEFIGLPVLIIHFPSSFQSNWSEITDNFDDMNLKETLLRGIYAYGFEKPSAIQQRAIIPCIKGTLINCFCLFFFFFKYINSYIE